MPSNRRRVSGLLVAAMFGSGCSAGQPRATAPKTAGSRVGGAATQSATNAPHEPSVINGKVTCLSLVGKPVVTPVVCINGTVKLFDEFNPAIGEPCGGSASQQWFLLILAPLYPGVMYGKTGGVWQLAEGKKARPTPPGQESRADQLKHELGC